MDEPRQDPAPTGVRQRVGPLCPFAAVIGIVVGIWGLYRWWAGEPYPEEDPAQTMERLHGYSQTAYDAVGMEDEVSPSAETTPCAPTGFRGSWSANASTEAFGVSYNWYASVDAEAGRRSTACLREGPVADGWQVSMEEFSDPEHLELRMNREEDGLVARFDRESWRDEGPVLELDFYSVPGVSRRLRPDRRAQSTAASAVPDNGPGLIGCRSPGCQPGSRLRAAARRLRRIASMPTAREAGRGGVHGATLPAAPSAPQR